MAFYNFSIVFFFLAVMKGLCTLIFCLAFISFGFSEKITIPESKVLPAPYPGLLYYFILQL